MTIEVKYPVLPHMSRAHLLLPAAEHYPSSDRLLFQSGYHELCKHDLNGSRVMEICGGAGKLSSMVAETFPKAQVIGLDRYAASGPEIDKRLARLPGLSYVSGDAFDLSMFEEDSFDLIWGQAALHHLAHDTAKLCHEILRVLKPGGRLVFIFEPLGQNLLVAAIRAIRMAKLELIDESNVYFSQLESMKSAGFSKCEVQVFNLLGYPMKALSDRFVFISAAVQRMDGWLFLTFPKLLFYGANCNVIFTK